MLFLAFIGTFINVSSSLLFIDNHYTIVEHIWHNSSILFSLLLEAFSDPANIRTGKQRYGGRKVTDVEMAAQE